MMDETRSMGVAAYEDSRMVGWRGEVRQGSAMFPDAGALVARWVPPAAKLALGGVAMSFGALVLRGSGITGRTATDVLVFGAEQSLTPLSYAGPFITGVLAVLAVLMLVSLRRQARDGAWSMARLYTMQWAAIAAVVCVWFAALSGMPWGGYTVDTSAGSTAPTVLRHTFVLTTPPHDAAERGALGLSAR